MMNAKSYKEIGINFKQPECVNIRKCQKFMRAGHTFNGKPLIVKDGHICGWEKNEVWKKWQYAPIAKTASEYLKMGKLRKYEVGDWSVRLLRSKGQVKELDFYFMGNTEQYDFSPVIDEAKKHGFNVDAEFLADQVENILAGYKQNRFLPDRSGEVFSPIRANGCVFRFARIMEDSKEYVG